MKKTIGMALIRLLQLLSVVFLSAEAFCREPNPPEIQALIGMKIPAKTELKAVFDKETNRYEMRERTVPNAIPAFVPVHQEALTYHKDDFSIGLESGFAKGIPGLIVSRQAPDLSIEITDALAVGPNIPEWQLRDSNVVYVKGRYRLSTDCQYSDRTKDITRYVRFIGFVKPLKNKNNCAHMSGRVKQAWGIERDTGQITGISTAGLVCHYFTMNDCE